MRKEAIFFLILLIFLYPVSAANMYNHVYNGSSWVPALATADGQQKYWINMANASYGEVQYNMTISERLGIGTSNPSHELNIIGDANITGDLYLNSSSIYLGDKKISVVNNELVFDDQNVTPPGMIAIFNGTCPTGWHEVNETRGRYITGTPEGGTIGATVGTALSNSENRAVGNHSHGGSANSAGSHDHDLYSYSNNEGWIAEQYAAGTDYGVCTNSKPYITTSTTTDVNCAGTCNCFRQIRAYTAGAHSHTLSVNDEGDVDGTNAPYIQMTYCQKDAGSDYAEWIESDEKIEAGMIVSVDEENDKKVVKSSEEYEEDILGVVSTEPGWLIGRESKTAVQLALAGQVPVKVSLVNGEIKRGDLITSSNISGYGMRAESGRIVGVALTELNEDSEGVYSCGENLCGEIEILLDLSWRSDENLKERVGKLEKKIDNLERLIKLLILENEIQKIK